MDKRDYIGFIDKGTKTRQKYGQLGKVGSHRRTENLLHLSAKTYFTQIPKTKTIQLNGKLPLQSSGNFAFSFNST